MTLDKPNESMTYLNRYKKTPIFYSIDDWLDFINYLKAKINTDLKKMPDRWYLNEIKGVGLIISEKQKNEKRKREETT